MDQFSYQTNQTYSGSDVVARGSITWMDGLSVRGAALAKGWVGLQARRRCTDGGWLPILWIERTLLSWYGGMNRWADGLIRYGPMRYAA